MTRAKLQRGVHIPRGIPRLAGWRKGTVFCPKCSNKRVVVDGTLKCLPGKMHLSAVTIRFLGEAHKAKAKKSVPSRSRTT